MDMKLVCVYDNEPEKGKDCLVKGLKSVYYAGEYSGRGIDGKPLFWIPCENKFFKEEYYIPMEG